LRIVLGFLRLYQAFLGWASLVDLAKILNVELRHVEEAAQEITKYDSNFVLSLGRLITK
jgi:hypothetical protein